MMCIINIFDFWLVSYPKTKKRQECTSMLCFLGIIISTSIILIGIYCGLIGFGIRNFIDCKLANKKLKPKKRCTPNSAFKSLNPSICKASRIQNWGGCYSGITPLVKCGMERSTVCMGETNPLICARLWWRNDVIFTIYKRQIPFT